MRDWLSSVSGGAAQGMRRFLGDEGGATAIEYALIASCVGAAIAAVVVTTGSSLRDGIYQKIFDAYPG